MSTILRVSPWRSLLIPLSAIALSGCATSTEAPSAAPDSYPTHAADAAYDLNLAMELAGVVVPMTVESFYFLVIDDTLAPLDDVAETRRLLQLASDEEDFLGITGPQAHRNVAVVRAALESADADEFNGATLIFLGPAEHVDALREPARESGTRLRFMIYPPGLPPMRAPASDTNAAPL